VSEQITLEEWLAAMAAVESPSLDGLTITGWARKLNLSPRAVSKLLAVGLDNGWVQRVTVLLTQLTGGQRRHVGFKILNRKNTGKSK